MIPEVILPDGRKLLLDTTDSEKEEATSQKFKTEAEVLAKNCIDQSVHGNNPVRMSSPSPSESSSTPIIVDEDVDVVNPKTGSSGVSSDNESNTNSNTTKSSGSPPEKDAAAQLAAAQAAAQASGLVPITVTSVGQSQNLVSQNILKNSDNNSVTEQLTEYYKQQFAAIYAQQQAQVASGQTTLANAQNLLPTLQGTTTAATQLAINLLKQNGVQKM